MRDFYSQAREWQRIPVDDVGYVNSGDLLLTDDHVLRETVHMMERVRYTGWRNHDGLWRQEMGLDTFVGGRVLDYGCGIGIEALQYARAKNRVWVADINSTSAGLAARVLRLHGFQPGGSLIIGPDQRLQPPPVASFFDLVVMNGVLHHIENPRAAVEEAHRVLRPEAQLRVMVYTDRWWREVTGTEPPEDVTDAPGRLAFVRAGDQVGDWADWYSEERMIQRFGDLFAVERWTYITPWDRYAICVMRRLP